ncbi:DUF2975 domain-containing protein [Gracilimonas tropica]|uniref:DUF2975 domain-containing protein n=1 Tax=Gracilimonas tropica TaxID=454600 RepID=UPI00037EDAF1|nr:DUF2975 domain-containing protein [Gracilimonas tropica]
MDLNKKILPDSLFQKVIIGLMIVFAGLSLWGGFWAFQNMQSIIEKDLTPESKEGMTSYGSSFKATFGSFEFNQIANMDTSFTYVTLTDLTFSPSGDKTMDILSSSSKDDRILGLSSHPSFLVSDDHRSFWISQIYLEMGFLIGGIFIIILIVIWIISANFESYKKLFNKEIYHRVMTLFFVVFAGFLINALLYARRINFLNTEFNLDLSLTDGVSMTMLFILFLLLFLIIFVRKGIPLQNEQDLTV